MNKKFNPKNIIRTGVSTKLRKFNLMDSLYIPEIDVYQTLLDYSGNDLFSKAFFQYQHKFSDRLQMNIGVNSMFQSSNKNYSIEPRTGLKWEFQHNQHFSLGYGLHSIYTPIEVLQQEVRQTNGTLSQPNIELNFTKSNHFVFGYDTNIFKNIRFKSELYYQYITDALVELTPSSYSLLNHGGYNTLDISSLKNGGTGYNYGLELTLEEFMYKGTYFLSTLSLFESKYRSNNGILHNTAFNTNFVFNLLGGGRVQIAQS